MANDFQFDVFLSHSAKDKAVVPPLAEQLRAHGLKVWFEWVLKPGDNIPAKTEEGLENSRVLVLCMSANPDAVPRIGPDDIPVRVMLKPFSADDLYHAVRDAITRSTDLTNVAEAEIVLAHAGLSRLARALEDSRTTRVHTLDLVVAARELRRIREQE